MSNDGDSVRARADASHTMVLTFVAGDRVAWRVSERDARGDPGRHADWCLVFSSPEAVRRVWNYPEDWHELTDTELEALSWKC